MKSGDCLGTPCGHVAEVCVNLDTGPFTSSASLQGNCRSVHGGPCHELQIMECLHARLTASTVIWQTLYQPHKLQGAKNRIKTESFYHLTTPFHVQRPYDHTIESCGKMDERPAEGTVVIRAGKTKNCEVRQLVTLRRLG